MRSDRLLTLAKRLDKVPVKQFDMSYWGMEWDPEAGETVDFAPADPTKECGFAGCAVGWACSIPEFIDAGFRLFQGTPTYNPGGFVVWQHFDAPVHFFDITEDQAHYLFGMSYYTGKQFKGPRYVASRLREFVREGGLIHRERKRKDY